MQVGALVAVVALAFMVWRALRGADERRGPLTRPLVVAALVAVVGLGWTLVARAVASEPPPAAIANGHAAADAPNVILIMVDTLRADHLSCYGYRAIRRRTSTRSPPTALRYAHMFAQASWTRPSVATILTGLYPSSHGAIHKADMLPDRVETLAEVLAKGGYHTAGFPNNINVSPAFNFEQGFAEYHYLAPDLFFCADEAGGAADALQRPAPRARALLRTLRERAQLLPAGRNGGRARCGAWLDGADGEAGAVLPLPPLHGPARPVHDPSVQRRGVRARRECRTRQPELADKYRRSTTARSSTSTSTSAR